MKDFDISIIQEKQRRLWTYDDTPSLILFFIALYLLLSYIFPAYLYAPVNVFGSSMVPTLHQGDRVILYMQGEIDYGNIVVLYAPKVYNQNTGQYGEDIIKRVMGKPGDTVWFEKKEDKYVFYRQSVKDGMVATTILENEYYINNRDKTYNNGEYDSKYRLGVKFELKEDEYFVLGDNRDISLDSRSSEVGLVKRSQIKGKALFLIREGKVYVYNKTFF